MQRHAFLVHPVEEGVGILVVDPGTVGGTQPAERQFYALGVGFDTPFSHTELSLEIQSDQLVVSETVAVLNSH